MNEVLSLTFASSLTDLCEANSSFDTGVLRIAYPGENQNKTYISKQAFENAVNTMYNCPVVCNYDRETETIGSHDIELVRNGDGSLRIVNATQPVGIVPESAHVFWQTVEEEDGTEHEYICAEVLLWKRQEAYKKIKDDGVTAQSMEINVKSGKRVDGIYHINDFEFTAFTLLGSAQPCFESAALTFSKEDFKIQLSEMMLDLKESFKRSNPSDEGCDIHPQQYSMEGGEKVLSKEELIEKYGIDVDALDFSIDDFSVEELEEKFEAMSQADNGEADADTSEDTQNFALTQGVLEELHASLATQKVQREWGESSKYSYVDCDFEASEVYAFDTDDWKLYGFKYEVNGDNINIDFESKTRKKFAIVDFDEGEQPALFAEVYAQMEQKIADDAKEFSAIEEKYNDIFEKYSNLETEVNELRAYKADVENTAAVNEQTEKINEVFAKFEDLDGVEMFEALKTECEEDCMKYEIDVLEEKCFAIRGRQNYQLKFAANQGAPRIKVEKENNVNLPYGGIFEKYGFSAK